jgi:phospholipid/cholesterol/gamma-HCH transport system substrate-binding protein
MRKFTWPAGLDRRRTVALVVALALLAAAAVVAGRALTGGDSTRLTVYFDRAVNVHEGSDVRVLGVTVGTVRSVTPEPTRVKITLTVDSGVTLPADAHAVSIAPSLVSGRYVQLTPAYTSGPQLRDGDVIPVDRTAAPLEVDQLYASITELSETLGPDGVNRNGALSELLDVGAENLRGNGQALSHTLENFGSAAGTLAASREDFFGTIENLQAFTTMLKENDTGIREAQEQLADVSGFLAADRRELAAALTELGAALGEVDRFISDNRGRIKSNVDKLSSITGTLVRQRASLAEALDTAPLAAGNFLGTYNPATGTFDGRANLNEISGLLPLGASDVYRSAGQGTEADR